MLKVMIMITGTCMLELRIYEADSLKGKRKVIKSIMEKLKSRFNISIAEVGLNDVWKSSIIGFSCVSNNTAHVNETISKVLNFIEGDSRVKIMNQNIEII